LRQESAPLKEAYARSMRRLAVLFGVGVTITFVLLAPPWPGENGWQMFMLAAAWALVCMVVYLGADRWLAAAQLLFLITLPGMAAAAAWQLEKPALAALALVTPLLAAMVAGWPAGFIAVALVTALMTVLAKASVLALPLETSGAVLIGSTALLTATGWIVARELAETGIVATQSLERAQLLVEEARVQRLELRQVEEDLLQATREQVRLLRRLEALNQIAEEARQTKQAFIANVSHELRTPLNMIIAYAELITQSPHLYSRRLPASLLADMAVIQRNSQHLSRLVDDVLDLSQIEAGRMALSKEWTTIESIIETATEAVRPLFNTKGLRLETEIAAALPEIYCDKTRIRQVIINLLSNAGRFTERGGVAVRAWIVDAKMMLSVADSGPGIKPEDQHRLFEPFQQLDSSIRRKHGGSGLGLNISKHFIEMHDGRIWLESELGVGTTFFVSLPLDSTPEPRSEAQGAPRWVSPYHEYSPRTRPRVAKIPHVARRYVFLDGGSTLPRLFSRYVDDVEIVAAGTTSEALTLLSETPAHAFIVNSASLPKGESINSIPSTLPFDTPIFACWLTSDDSVQQLGIVRYLVKPVSGATLLEALHGLPGSARTVLVADDEPDLLRLFTRILAGTPENYRVICATNGAEALTLLRENQPDVLILDLVMPQMSGFDLLKEKETDPTIASIPVIVISSRDPSSQPIVSNQLFLTRGRGLSMRDLLDCIESLTKILTPVAPHEHRAPPTAPGA